MADKSLSEMLDEHKAGSEDGADEKDGSEAEQRDAGEALKAALESGDGLAIYQAYETLNALCEQGEYGEDGEEPEPDGHGKGLLMLLGPHKE